MFERPDIDEAEIASCLRRSYGLEQCQIAFLPLGADPNTAVYRVGDGGGSDYFLKLRSGAFDATSVTLPRFLHDQGLTEIIAPVAARDGRCWAEMDAFTLILFPFVEGRNGYEVSLTEGQWIAYGSALQRLHTLALPAELNRAIRREAYAPTWRAIVNKWLARVEIVTFEEPVAAAAAALVRQQRDVLAGLVRRAEQYARDLRLRSLPYVVCHSDLHAGNFHVTADGAFYLVDWDDTVLAPKERDLMYVGGGLMAGWRSPEEEEKLFYQGYGRTGIDQQATAYYRYERIVADIAVYCEELLATTEGGDDREMSLHYLQSNFEPGGTIEIAAQADRS